MLRTGNCYLCRFDCRCCIFNQGNGKSFDLSGICIDDDENIYHNIEYRYLQFFPVSGPELIRPSGLYQFSVSVLPVLEDPVSPGNFLWIVGQRLNDQLQYIDPFWLLEKYGTTFLSPQQPQDPSCPMKADTNISGKFPVSDPGKFIPPYTKLFP